MEAETFEIVDQALRSNVRVAKLPVRQQCCVQRVVWSVWNYIVGPELKFAWEVVPDDLNGLGGWAPAAADQRPGDCEADEDRYVAMHTLSSEIYRVTTSDRVEFKVLRLPERRMAIAAYVFRARHRDQQCVNSVALMVHENRLDWFLRLQPFAERCFHDLVVKLRTALLIESSEEVLSRLTSELGHLLLVLGLLECRSFQCSTFDIADTYFADPSVAENPFLAKCISAHLQCQGHTIVVGNFAKSINKMLKTLAFVTYRDLWPMCKLVDVENADVDCGFEVLCSRDNFSPHLFLQGVSKLYFNSIVNQAYYSRWPFCVIDVDEKTVFDSLPFEKHSGLRREVLIRDIKKILMQDIPKKRLNISLTEHKPDNSLVVPFLRQMAQLPYGSAVRAGFTLQFLRSVALRAVALDTYARVESEDGARLKRSSVCRALDIKHRGDLMITLAAADLMRPDLAEFLFQSWSRQPLF